MKKFGQNAHFNKTNIMVTNEQSIAMLRSSSDNAQWTPIVTILVSTEKKRKTT